MTTVKIALALIYLLFAVVAVIWIKILLWSKNAEKIKKEKSPLIHRQAKSEPPPVPKPAAEPAPDKEVIEAYFVSPLNANIALNKKRL